MPSHEGVNGARRPARTVRTIRALQNGAAIRRSIGAISGGFAPFFFVIR
jgi:hypothetical protein